MRIRIPLAVELHEPQPLNFSFDLACQVLVT